MAAASSDCHQYSFHAITRRNAAERYRYGLLTKASFFSLLVPFATRNNLFYGRDLLDYELTIEGLPPDLVLQLVEPRSPPLATSWPWLPDLGEGG